MLSYWWKRTLGLCVIQWLTSLYLGDKLAYRCALKNQSDDMPLSCVSLINKNVWKHFENTSICLYHADEFRTICFLQWMVSDTINSLQVGVLMRQFLLTSLRMPLQGPNRGEVKGNVGIVDSSQRFHFRTQQMEGDELQKQVYWLPLWRQQNIAELL